MTKLHMKIHPEHARLAQKLHGCCDFFSSSPSQSSRFEDQGMLQAIYTII